MQFEIDLVFAFARRLRVEKAVRSIKSKLIYGTYPQDAKNGGILVVTEMLALLENSAIDRQST